MARRHKYHKRPIVTGYLETVSSAIFDRQREAITDMTKGAQGLYALYRKNKLYYVGLASNLRGRINGHLKDRHQGRWTHFSLYIIKHPEHIKELESLLLRIAWPAGNSVRGRLRRSANLLPLLKKRVRMSMLDEANALFTNDRLNHHKKANGAAALRAWKTRRKRTPRPAKGLFPKTVTIYARCKGEIYRAWLRRSGSIRFDDKMYDSPSAAGSAARGGKPTDGWTFWRVKRGDRLVGLREFRT